MKEHPPTLANLISAALLLAGVGGVIGFGSGCIHTRIATRTVHEFERVQLSDVFYAEGAGIGDLNRDGTPDVVAGPYWYAGPEFEQRHEIYPPEPFDPLQYSDNFVVDIHDFDGDGWEDVLVVGFPGEQAFWYENSADGDGHWERHVAFDGVDNESPFVGDLTGDGRPELVFHHEGYVGYAVADEHSPTAPWTFHRISEQGEWGPFTHGFGIGDVTGDGHPDILMSSGWWENPGPAGADGRLWQHHPADFGERGAQIYAYDVDGDGDNDVISSLDAHGWGIAWFEQTRSAGEIDFDLHLIIGEHARDNPYGTRFSQPHAIALVDVDRDGHMDIVTGKRYWAHGPDGDPEPNAPAVLYWFRLVRSADGDVSFVPHLIDDDSGVGVFLAVGDLTGDAYPDIVMANKKGAFVFRQQVREVNPDEWEAAQPSMTPGTD